MNKFLILIMLILISGCRPLTTESPLILDIKKNLEANAENTIKLSKNVDKIADKIGLDIPSITPELKDALKQLQADNDKKYDLLDAKFNKILEMMLKMGAGAVGIPPAVTNAGIGITETSLGGVALTLATKLGSDFLANRRREREAQEKAEELAEKQRLHEEKLAEEKRKHDAELALQEQEREGMRLRLEREKEELRVKALIKQKTMAKVKPEYQLEYDRCREEAERELRARGEI